MSEKVFAFVVLKTSVFWLAMTLVNFQCRPLQRCERLDGSTQRFSELLNDISI